MKNYDDLQRFKEKTQTLDIAFKDMSGQTQEAAEQSKWALIRQLAKDDQTTPFDSNQRIDLPQPQPIRGDEFSDSAQGVTSRPAGLATPSSARGSILDSLTPNASVAPVAAPTSGLSSLFPPPLAQAQPVAEPVTQPAPAAFQPAPAMIQPVVVPAQAAPAAQPQPVFAAASAPVAAPAAVSSAEPGRFGALFRSRHSEPVSLSKETLLKPLLEKIALCR